MSTSTLFCVFLLFSGILSGCQGREGFGPGEQDWGFVDVRTGAHMFYWLYYTTASVAQPQDRPLVIWLQGGPGASSEYGNFAEIGPLHINLTERSSSWVKHVNLLFIDNPVGTGYSYVDRTSLMVTNNVEIGADLVTFMRSFYSQYSQFKSTPLYIFCESYGGKMTIEFARQLDLAVKGGLDINFQGVALGDSWISPIDSVLTWAPFLLATGLVDKAGYDKVDKSARQTETALNNGQYETATSLWGATEGVVLSVTNGVDFYNILYKTRSYYSQQHREIRNKKQARDLLYHQHVFDATKDDDADLDRLMNGEVKEALGIPSNVYWGGQSGYVFDYLYADFMKPVTDVVETVLNTTSLSVAVFSGQLDLIVDTPGTVIWVDRLKWDGSNSWANADRKPIVIDGYTEGYTKQVGQLTFYWIDRAGHMVPTDNPHTAVEMLRRVTKYDKV